MSQGESGAYGMLFQLSQDSRLTSAMFPIMWGDFVDVGFNVAIYQRSGSERLSHIETIRIAAGQVSLLSAQSLLQPLLTANTEYLLGMFVQRRNTWLWNNAGIAGPYIVRGPNVLTPSSGPLSAFQLTGEPIPEPATLLLFATGAGFVAHRRARGRRRV